MSAGSHPWGRVAEDGTVYVRTAQGERVVGIWQAGSPDEALEFFTRRYDSLATEVGEDGQEPHAHYDTRQPLPHNLPY